MAAALAGKKIAVLVTDGFEQVELTEPVAALRAAGAQVDVVSPKAERVKAWKFKEWGEEFPVDVPLERARAEDYDGLVLPGGVMNPDFLRLDRRAVGLVKAFFSADRPVAAICHGPWLLAEADVVRGRRMTSYPSIRTDLRNAGAEWVDEEVVTDGGLVTSRKPDDLPAFNGKIVEVFAEGRPARRAA